MVRLTVKVVWAASVSIDFFKSTPNKNHPTLTLYLASPSSKNPVLLEIPLISQKSDTVSIVTTACATMFEQDIFVRRESGPHRLVTVMLVHISIIFT